MRSLRVTLKFHLLRINNSFFQHSISYYTVRHHKSLHIRLRCALLHTNIHINLGITHELICLHILQNVFKPHRSRNQNELAENMFLTIHRIQ
ncbi:hypothetical protein D3C78_1362890 [compost metagenome]